MDGRAVIAANWDGSCRLNWGGEDRRFRLAIGELRDLQMFINRDRQEFPVGPMTLLRQVSRGDAWPADVREVIRLGLIGGGETRSELINGLMKRYFDERPLFESSIYARIILGAALLEIKGDELKKNEGIEPTIPATTLSDFPSYMDPAQQSDLRRARSTTADSGNSQHVSRDGIGQTDHPTTLTP